MLYGPDRLPLHVAAPNAAAKHAKPRAPDTFPPTREQEKAAARRLDETLGYMQPLLGCFTDFFSSAFARTDEGRLLNKKRQRKRCSKRVRAMGVSGLRVDVSLGLLNTLPGGVPAFERMCDEFRQDERFSAPLWSDAQILRVVFRHGLVTGVFDPIVSRWPNCFFGILTSALFFASDYLSTAQVRAVRTEFRRCGDLSAAFARNLLLGKFFGAGEIYLFDACQPDVQPVAFTHASLYGFTRDLGPHSTDLASLAPGVAQGPPPHVLPWREPARVASPRA